MSDSETLPSKAESRTTIKLTNLTNNYGKIPDKQHAPLVELTRPHRDSFNWLLKEGLYNIIKDLPPVDFTLRNGTRVALEFEEIKVEKPTISTEKKAQNQKNFSTPSSAPLYPSECRERGMSYVGLLAAKLRWKVGGKLKGMAVKDIGGIPIMVKSNACYLQGLSPKDLIAHGEDAEEMGGYFVINGIEKVVRMLIMPRRNYPLAMTRQSWKSRGAFYTEMGVQIRSVKADQSSLTNTLHYLTSGNVTVSFTYRKEQFFVPVIMILKCLINQTDHYIFHKMMQGSDKDSFLKTSVIEMIRSSLNTNVQLKSQQVIVLGDGSDSAILMLFVLSD